MDIAALAASPLEAYIQFKYPEIKDLLKHFLTLISATLVFSVTFSEKVIDYHKSQPRQKRMVFAAWALLVLALIACGIGIFLNYMTAQEALAAIVSKQTNSFVALQSLSYLSQDLAGALYVLALLVLVAAAIVRTKAPEAAPQ